MSASPSSSGGTGEVTRLLHSVRDGEEGALGQLVEVVYSELKAIGQRQLGSAGGHTLQPTALVHEAFLKLVEQENVDWRGRAHFFAIASRLIRRVLCDAARARGRLKRGGDRGSEPLEGHVLELSDQAVDLLEIDEALTALADHDELGAKIVEMSFFAGLEQNEIAEALQIGKRTVQRHLAYAKAWLQRFLGGEDDPH